METLRALAASLGLGLLVAGMHTAWYRTGNPRWRRMATFWGRIYLANFALGVATGLVQDEVVRRRSCGGEAHDLPARRAALSRFGGWGGAIRSRAESQNVAVEGGHLG